MKTYKHVAPIYDSIASRVYTYGTLQDLFCRVWISDPNRVSLSDLRESLAFILKDFDEDV